MPEITEPEIARLADVDEAAMAVLGRCLGLTAQPGQVWLLEGPLGAGKTHLARAFIRARLGQPEAEVPSPSFTLVQTYDDPAGGEIWHADLYRLSGAADVGELGLDEAEAGDIRLIEWPDRLAAAPAGALRVCILPVPASDLRTVVVSQADGGRMGAPEEGTADAEGRGKDAVAGVARAVALARFIVTASRAAAGSGTGTGIGSGAVGGVQVAALAGDASSRRYFRLSRGAWRAVVMDAAPGSLGSYLSMTDWLRDRGFHAPAILVADPDAGFLLLEDLGDNLLARALAADPCLAGPAYQRLAGLLARLHGFVPAPGIAALDGAELAQQAGLFSQWYAPAMGAPDGLGPPIAEALRTLYGPLCADVSPVTALRDFHAENIIWLGDAPPGLLDFQDAVAAHPAYDLVSLLQDVRRDVGELVEHDARQRYLATTGADPERFTAAYALLGAARNLRILGIFARLCLRDGKPRYLDFVPRAWALLARDLRHPVLAPLARVLADVPAPTAACIDAMRLQCPVAPKP